MSDHVTYTLVGAVAHIAIDDGKANALSHTILTALNEGLDRAEREAKAVVLEVVIETRDRSHLEATIAALRAANLDVDVGVD